MKRLLITFMIGFQTTAFAATSVVPMDQKSPEVAEKKKLIDDILKIRDPFRAAEIDAGQAYIKTELERYPLDAFKLVGVLTGPKQYRALVFAPDGKTYFVREQMKMGLNQGIVRKITPTSLQIREKTVNLIGQEEILETELHLVADPKGESKQGKKL